MDDASTDAFVRVVREWIASRSVHCTFVAHEQNAGVCTTLNEALSHASGKYVSMISADDIWEPDKLERQVPLMEAAAEDVGVLYSDAWQMNENGLRIPGFSPECIKRYARAVASF
jgi:glycosyltransferase involved in cell wall biosynthesis